MSFFKRLWQTLFGETKSAPEQLSDEDLQRERIKLKTKRDELETEITKLADTENQLKEEFKLALQQKNATAQRSIANKLQELEKDRKIAENRLVKVNKEYRATTTIQVIKEEEGSRSPFGANQQDWEKYLIGKTVEEQMRQETLDTIERYGDEVINAMGGDEQEMTTNDYMAKLAAELGEEAYAAGKSQSGFGPGRSTENHRRRGQTRCWCRATTATNHESH